MIPDILFEDEWLLAVDKPAGLVVHPTYKNAAGTLLDLLRARNGGTRLFVLGRLDKLTSGVVLLAKDPETNVRMQREWPRVDKDYLAVVEGVVEPTRGEINLPLGSDPADRRRRIVRPDGAPSVTRFERLASSAAGMSLLRCRLVTGRRHQIRVHLAAQGWPIVGDPVYGRREEPAFPRQALHAWRVVVPHPNSRESLQLIAPPPADLSGLLAAAGLPLTCHLHL